MMMLLIPKFNELRFFFSEMRNDLGNSACSRSGFVFDVLVSIEDKILSGEINFFSPQKFSTALFGFYEIAGKNL